MKILDVNVMIAVEIRIAVLFFSKILFDPLDRSFVSFFAGSVVEDDPERFRGLEVLTKSVHLQLKQIHAIGSVAACGIGEKEIQVKMETANRLRRPVQIHLPEYRIRQSQDRLNQN